MKKAASKRLSKSTQNLDAKPLSKVAHKQLHQLRQEIDRIDREFMNALAKRFRIVEKVGRLKVKYNLPILQLDRIALMREARKADARRLKLDPDLIYEMFELIHDASVACQEEVKRTAAKKKKTRKSLV